MQSTDITSHKSVLSLDFFLSNSSFRSVLLHFVIICGLGSNLPKICAIENIRCKCQLDLGTDDQTRELMPCDLMIKCFYNWLIKLV